MSEVSGEVLRTCQAVIDSYQTGRGVPATSWFLIGSHAVGDNVDLSDIDMLGIATSSVIFDGWQDSERARWDGRVEIHVKYIGDLNLMHHAHLVPMLKGGILLAGDDVRASIAQLDLNAYRATVFYRFRRGVDQFFPDGPTGAPGPGPAGFPASVVDAPPWTGESVWTHDLVVFLGLGATAVGAVHGLVAGSRAEAIANLARAEGAAEWPSWVRESVDFLRRDHGYRAKSDREFLDRLDAISDQVPQFVSYCLDRIAQCP